jgi:hypothetical protein
MTLAKYLFKEKKLAQQHHSKLFFLWMSSSGSTSLFAHAVVPRSGIYFHILANGIKCDLRAALMSDVCG